MSKNTKKVAVCGGKDCGVVYRENRMYHVTKIGPQEGLPANMAPEVETPIRLCPDCYQRAGYKANKRYLTKEVPNAENTS